LQDLGVNKKMAILPLPQWFSRFVCISEHGQGRELVAPIDRTDIRGLGGVLHGFVADRPLSASGNSAYDSFGEKCRGFS
jgi:hypothetical protein